MKETIVCILAFAFLIPFWNFTPVLENYLSLIPYIIYTITLVIVRKNIHKSNEETEANENITISDIYKAFFFNFLFFVMFACIFGGFVKLCEKFFTKNVLYFIIYVWLTQNAAITSPGFKICKILIDRTTLGKSISLLLFNVYKFSIFIYGLCSEEFRKSSLGISIFSLIFLFYLINIFYRFFISKKYSLVEHLLKIKYQKVENDVSKHS